MNKKEKEKRQENRKIRGEKRKKKENKMKQHQIAKSIPTVPHVRIRLDGKAFDGWPGGMLGYTNRRSILSVVFAPRSYEFGNESADCHQNNEWVNEPVNLLSLRIANSAGEDLPAVCLSCSRLVLFIFLFLPSILRVSLLSCSEWRFLNIPAIKSLQQAQPGIAVHVIQW